MNLWYGALVSLILLISVLLIIKSDDFERKAAIEVNIVQKNEGASLLGNETFKNVFARGKVKQHVPKFMLELYEKSKSFKKHELGSSTPDIVRSVVPEHPDADSYYLPQGDINIDHHLLIFNVPKSNVDELFVRAELRVLTVIELKCKLALGIEREIKISLYNETTKEINTLEEKHIYHTDNTWISFNVSNAVKSILSVSQDENKVLQLVISIKSFLPFVDSKIGIFKLSLMPVTENFEHDYPILLLFYVSAKSEITAMQPSTEMIVSRNESHKTERRRRFIEDDYEEETNKLWDDESVNKAVARRMKRMRNNCRRKPLYIDFAEIQYDSWIVQPSGYEAYQCSGKCFYPVADHLSPTKHAIVQALLHSVAPARAPRSCCVPTKLDSISVLYVDAHGVLTYRYGYKDMVVTECGCR